VKLDIPKLRDTLDAKGFVVSLRDGLDDSKCIRVAPHFYNTEEEILRFLANVPRVP
jgi:selenocysteine lyase/cysteine desulfurase